MSKTKIEWAEESWNPVTGCTKISPGCKNCYAERMARRLAGRHGYPETPNHFGVTLRPERLDIPLRRKKPTTYFIPSMGDLFHKDVPYEFIEQIFGIINQTPQHTYQILTKHPDRMAKVVKELEYLLREQFDSLFPNVWLGVSTENQTAANERILLLLQTSAAMRFVSLEPLLGPVDIHPFLGPRTKHRTHCLDWVIVGGESGPGARPMHPDWARGIRDQCQAAGVPFFFKQWGVWLHQSQTTAQQRGEMHDKVKSLPSHKWPNNSYSWRVRKKYAGRLLDGREWNEMPR